MSHLGRKERGKLDKIQQSIGINLPQHSKETTVYNYCVIHEDQSERSSKTLLNKKIH